MTQVSNLKLQNQKKIANIKNRIKKLENKKKKSTDHKRQLNRLRQQLHEAVAEANATIAKNKRVDDIVSDKKLEMKLSHCERQLNTCEINYQKSLTLTDKLIENVKNGVKSLEQLSRFNETAQSKRPSRMSASVRPMPTKYGKPRWTIQEQKEREKAKLKLDIAMQEQKERERARLENEAAMIKSVGHVRTIDCNNQMVARRTSDYYDKLSHLHNPWGPNEYEMVRINRSNRINSNTCDVNYTYKHKNGKTGLDTRRFNYRLVGPNMWEPVSMNKIPRVNREGFLALNDIEIDYPNSKYVRDISSDDPTMNYM